MNGLKPLKKLAEAMKKNKKLELFVYAALIALGIVVYFAFSTSAQTSDSPKAIASDSGYSSIADGERATEERLKSVLSCIRGAGKVEVMITYDTGAQIVPAMNVDTQTSTSSSSNDNGETVTQNRTESQQPVSGSGNSTVVLTEKQPEIRGVIVIAEGAADISVRLDLQSAVKTVLGVDEYAIEVFEMKLWEDSDER